MFSDQSVCIRRNSKSYEQILMEELGIGQEGSD